MTENLRALNGYSSSTFIDKVNCFCYNFECIKANSNISPARRVSYPLCFDNHPNCSAPNSFLLIFIQMPRGVGVCNCSGSSRSSLSFKLFCRARQLIPPLFNCFRTLLQHPGYPQEREAAGAWSPLRWRPNADGGILAARNLRRLS
jgi:hypothetical protein